MEKPAFIYGTAWKEERTAALVGQALEAGFRAIDTANQRKHYHEAGVGEALRAAFEGGKLKRDDLFLQTKFTYVRGQDHRLPYDPSAPTAEQVRQSFASSLEHLGVTHLDSLVLHGPMYVEGLAPADHESWRAMETIQRDGGARVIGISNVGAEQLEALLEIAEVKPAYVQNRCYAVDGWDADVRAICAREGIVYQGFSLLTANRQVLEHPIVRELAERHRRTVPQVIFRFAAHLGILPLTGTTNPVHMRQDLEAPSLALTSDELDALWQAST
jgi:diketogulonate reductase-like aldo/keto reductase